MTAPQSSSSTLFLVPNTLGSPNGLEVLPPDTLSAIYALKHFIVENAKTARAFIKSVNHPLHVSEIEFIELEKHNKSDMDMTEELLKRKVPAGLLSEAGMPCIADPGSEIVRLALKHNYTIKPLLGPSSILLALVASGLNGQQFTFNGYLPVKSDERKVALKELETTIRKTGYTQIFIETPYRNEGMLQDILSTIAADLYLCIAANLMQADETVITKRISEWKQKPFEIGKRPCMFLIGK